MGSKTQGLALDLHHGNETCSDLCPSDLVAEDQVQHSSLELGKLQRLVCIAVSGMMMMTPTAAMEVSWDLLLCMR